MPCIPIPKQTIPTLTGINITPPLPIIHTPSIPNVCCIPPRNILPSIPLSLPPFLVNPAFVTLIETGIETVENFVAQFKLDCPRQ